MRKRQKIFLIVSVVALLICSTISIFAALPVFHDNYWTTPSLLTADDVSFLCKGMVAQVQLQAPTGIRYPFLLLMTVTTVSNGYQYRAYTSNAYSNGSDCVVNGYFLSDGSSTGFEPGMYVSCSGSFSGVTRFIDLSITGGMSNLSKSFNFNTSLTVDGVVYKNCIKLDDNETLIASVDFSTGEVTVYQDSLMFGTVINTSARSMAQSWIDARNVKRDGLSSGGAISPEEESSIYQAGYNDGEIHGYMVGHQEGESQGKKIGYQDGYSKGYESGNEAGYNNGYKTGYDFASQKIGPEQYSVGYEEGYTVGHSDGYREGFNFAMLNPPEGIKLDIPAIISSITGSVGSFLTTAFNIEIFGINIAGLLSVLILVAFVLIIVHLTKGGK